MLSPTDERNIYLINGDGTGLKRLTDGGAYRVSSWSSDGRKLAIEVIGYTFTDHEVYIFDVENGNMERITDNDVFDGRPVWVEM